MLVGAMGSCPIAGSASTVFTAALQFFAASQCLQERWPRQADIANGSVFDFIIVGAGTAGSTLAARLAEVADFDVLVIEAGGDPPIEAIVPGLRGALKASPYDWNFTTVNDGYSGQALLGGRQLQPRGKMLGGSGSMNDMVYARGHPSDYDEWEAITGPIWKFEKVLDYFIKTEHMTDEQIIDNQELMRYHGRNGEIEVTGTAESTFATKTFLEAFEELGFDIVNDMTYPYKIGAGRFSHTVRHGRRDSSLTALLNKAERANLRVIKNAFVTKILSVNNTAVGVRVETNDEELILYASNEVIVSAGTFNTAKLLQLSGIGPKEHLKELGIEVIQDLPVGDNLQDHIMVVTYLVSDVGTCTLNESTKYFEMIQYLYDSSGFLSFSDSMGAYVPKTGGADNVPHFAYYVSCIPQSSITYDACVAMSGYTNEVCENLDVANKQHELISLAVVLLKPKSRGKVRINTSDPLDYPRIYSGTLSHSGDFEGFAEAIQLAWSLKNTTYFKEKHASVFEFNIDECNGLDEQDFVLCHIRNLAMPAWHSVGTAAMGTVVDAELKVVGVGGLRVVDASVMPKIVRGNTNAPVVMIAEQAADLIKAAWCHGEDRTK